MWLPVSEAIVSIRLIFCVAILTALVAITRRLRQHSRVKSIKRQHGCQEPVWYPIRDAWGSDLIEARANAMKQGRYFSLYLAHFNELGKTFAERIRGQVTVNTTDPINVQQILALSFDDYGKDPSRVRAQAPFLGPSVFSDGFTWKRSRAMVKPIFTRAELSDLDQLEKFTDKFLDLIPEDGSMVDVQPLLHRLFLDVSMDFIFGRSLNALQVQVPVECSEFLHAFDNAQRWVSKRREYGWMSFRGSFDKDWINSYSIVHAFVDEQVRQVLEAKMQHEKADPDLISRRQRYILLDELAKQTRDPIELRYQILGVFMPGRDSTSVLVGNVLFELARHPHIWSQLREIALQLDTSNLTFEKLKSIAEFRHVLHETIRHVGPAARIVRSAVKDTVLPRGGGADQSSPIFIAKGTSVSMGTWCMNHDPDIWGDDVSEFKPERWKGRKTYWDFTPFSGGPRICPAQQQVLTHATYLLIRLMQKYESIQNRDPVMEYVEKINMGLESRNGVKVSFQMAGQMT